MAKANGYMVGQKSPVISRVIYKSTYRAYNIPNMLHGTGIFTYIYHKLPYKFMVNVGKYSIHGASGIYIIPVTHLFSASSAASCPSI